MSWSQIVAVASDAFQLIAILVGLVTAGVRFRRRPEVNPEDRNDRNTPDPE